MAMKFKVADLNDAADGQLLVEMFIAYSGYASELHEKGGKPDYEKDLAKRLRDHDARVFLVIDEESGEGAGFVIGFLRLSSHTLLNCLNLHDVSVSEKYRGRGIATEMMRFVEEYAREAGIGVLSLEVRGSNEVAKRLYRGCGFEGPEEILPANTHGYMDKWLVDRG
ncbi:GNAT family N-acetyltransferase [Planctomycetota bacterium]|nr:GNAT family N-acetyltransferase [Planctomycetota bacterium]